MDITFEGQLSKHEWRKINTLHYKPSKVSFLFRVAGLIILCLIVLFLIQNGIFDSVILIILTYFFLLLSYPFWVGHTALLSYNRNKSIIEPITGLANDEHIIIQAPNTTVEIKWELYKQVKQTKDLLLLYQNKNTFTFFPRRFFESDASWQVFIDMVQQKVNKR